MKITFLTALIAAACEAKRGKGKPEWTYACCKVAEKDGDADGITGALFFIQSDRQKGMKTFGSLSMNADSVDESGEECRYLGITEGASDDTCANPGDEWHFGEAPRCGLKPACFNESGSATYEYGGIRAQLADLIKEDSPYSISLYDTAERTDESVIDACCTIEKLDTK